MLSHIISNLRPGADLSRVVLPTFILEPRSMLERITKYVADPLPLGPGDLVLWTLRWRANPRFRSFMCHPEMLLHIPEIDDPVLRFVAVVKFYLSGWHIRPSFVRPHPRRSLPFPPSTPPAHTNLIFTTP